MSEGRPLPRRLEFLRPLARTIRRPYRRLQRRTVPRVIAGARDRIDGSAVALTFDDGPHPRYTHEVLDVLAAHDVRATFFVVGNNVRRHPELIRRIVAEGHAVASHSMTHTDPWTLGPLTLWRDYRAGHLELADVLGRDVRLFRPPKGYLDRRAALALRAAGRETWLWTIDAADWEPQLRPEDVVDRLGSPTGGEVILLHDAIEGPLHPDALDRSAMIGGLGRFLARAERDGLSFTTLERSGRDAPPPVDGDQEP